MKRKRLARSAVHNTVRVGGRTATLQAYLFEMSLMTVVLALPCPYPFFLRAEVIPQSLHRKEIIKRTRWCSSITWKKIQKFTLLRSSAPCGLLCTVPFFFIFFYCSQWKEELCLGEEEKMRWWGRESWGGARHRSFCSARSVLLALARLLKQFVISA